MSTIWRVDSKTRLCVNELLMQIDYFTMKYSSCLQINRNTNKQ